MKTKEQESSTSQAGAQMVSPYSLRGILACHAILTIVAFLAYPLLLWSQFALAGFWLALGKGPIWSRLLWILSALFILGIFLVGPIGTGEVIASVLWTIFFSCLFAGIGVMLLGQIRRWTLLRIQFRVWELIVGTASLALGFFVVDMIGDISATPKSLWGRFLSIFVHSSLLGLGTAAIGLTLLTRPGLPRRGARWVALLLTITIPGIDYLACEFLQFRPFKDLERVSFYLANLVIVWSTVLIYQDAINGGARMIFETHDKASESEEHQS